MSDCDRKRLPPLPEELADLLTYEDVADTLGVHVITVRRWKADGTLPHIKLGRLVRFHPRDVRDLIQRRYRVGKG